MGAVPEGIGIPRARFPSVILTRVGGGMSSRRGTCCARVDCFAASGPCAAGFRGGTNPKPEARRRAH